LRNEHRNPKTKANPNTMCLQNILGGDLGSGHFYLAKNRTFLLCVDRSSLGVASAYRHSVQRYVLLMYARSHENAASEVGKQFGCANSEAHRNGRKT
jgi:hypothetical protein